MSEQTLDEIISDMMDHPDTTLSAESKNTINFCRSHHPCCPDTFAERVRTVRAAIAGRTVHSAFHYRLDRLERAIRIV